MLALPRMAVRGGGTRYSGISWAIRCVMTSEGRRGRVVGGAGGVLRPWSRGSGWSGRRSWRRRRDRKDERFEVEGDGAVEAGVEESPSAKEGHMSFVWMKVMQNLFVTKEIDRQSTET